MRKRLRVLGVVVGVCAVGLGLLVAPVGATVTQPGSNPFNVPGDAAGNPKAFTVAADGFDPGAAVFVEQCDGTPPSTVGWTPASNCDLGSSPSGVVADASGLAAFNATDLNHAFKPFKGESPQSLFNCLASSDPQPSPNGLSDFTNCQVRVSTSNTAVTSDQQLFTITLPNAVTTSKVPLGRISCSATVQETVKKPVTAMPDPKKTNTLASLKPNATKSIVGSVAGTRVPGGSCDNSHVIGGKAALTAGSISIKAKGGPGWSCSNLLTPPLATKPPSSIQIGWQGLNSKGKLFTVGTSKTSIQSITVVTSPVLALDIVSTVVPAKGAFEGDRLVLHLVSDKTMAQLQADCTSPAGLGALNFTGVNGPSSIAATP